MKLTHEVIAKSGEIYWQGLRSNDHEIAAMTIAEYFKKAISGKLSDIERVFFAHMRDGYFQKDKESNDFKFIWETDGHSKRVFEWLRNEIDRPGNIPCDINIKPLRGRMITVDIYGGIPAGRDQSKTMQDFIAWVERFS